MYVVLHAARAAPAVTSYLAAVESEVVADLAAVTI